MEQQSTTPTRYTRYEEQNSVLSSLQHLSGVLDPNSKIGKGTFIEYVVLVTLGDCLKESFNYRYDLTSKKWGKINVKSSSLHKGNINPSWQFKKTSNSYDPDHYICVGLDSEFKTIHRVWVIPGNAKIVKSNGITITDSTDGRKKALKYEVDPVPYNNVYNNIDITSFPEFSNINVHNFEQYQSIMKDVQHGYSPSDIVDEYGDEEYNEYLMWVNESKSQKCFNLHNGSIGVFPPDRSFVTFPVEVFMEINESTFPIYNYTGKYMGYIHKGSFIRPRVTPLKRSSDTYTVIWAVQSLTRKYGKVSVDDLKKETGVEDIEPILKRCMMRGDIIRKNDNEYEWISQFNIDFD